MDRIRNRSSCTRSGRWQAATPKGPPPDLPFGHTGAAGYDRARRHWRHLDLGTRRLWPVLQIRRVTCPNCAVHTEHVPWARPTARHTHDFEDTVLWLAARTDRTTLMRCAWETATAIIDEHLDPHRLDAVFRIGVDEICYRHPHKYLTVIGDHDTRTVIDVQPSRSVDSLSNFYTQQSNTNLERIEVVTMDGSTAFRAATETHLRHAHICYDPFHVTQWTGRALDAVFSDAMAANRSAIEMSAGSWRRMRTALRTGANRLDPQRHTLVQSITRRDRQIGTAWRPKERLRELFRTVEPRHAARYVRRWVTAAERSGLLPFTMLATRIRRHYDGIVAAVELGVSNGLIEGINAKIRLINARGYGHHTARALTS